MNVKSEASVLQPWPTAPLSENEFEVEKDGVTLNVQKFANGTAMVTICDPETGINSRGDYAAYHRKPMAEVVAAMQVDGWALKTTQQMIVTQRGSGYGHCTVSGVCSPDVTVEDVKKRFYHWYFGGRGAWVRDGRFGCTIHTD
jgi:hypothetical protein